MRRRSRTLANPPQSSSLQPDLPETSFERVRFREDDHEYPDVSAVVLRSRSLAGGTVTMLELRLETGIVIQANDGRVLRPEQHQHQHQHFED